MTYDQASQTIRKLKKFFEDNGWEFTCSIKVPSTVTWVEVVEQLSKKPAPKK
jgi:hypothetical protein